jgi:aspartate kinase
VEVGDVDAETLDMSVKNPKTTDELVKMAYQVSPHPNRRELDMLLTTGERISMSLMSMALSDLGMPAISFTGVKPE